MTSTVFLQRSSPLEEGHSSMGPAYELKTCGSLYKGVLFPLSNEKACFAEKHDIGDTVTPTNYSSLLAYTSDFHSTKIASKHLD